MVIFCWYLISATERCVSWLFFVLRVYWHCSMHQINQISQYLFSRSLGVRQPIVCKGVASAIIDQPRCEILPPPHKAQSSPSETPLSRLHRLHKLHRFFRAELPWSHNIVQGLVLCATIALHCTGIALYCTGIVQGLGCALCIPHLMISCGSISPSIRKLQYEVTIAIAWLSHFLLEQLSLQTSLFSFLLLYPYPSMVGIFVVIRLSVGLDNFS